MTIFTPQERRALLFMIAFLLIGTGVTMYKRQNPSFAPELKDSASQEEADSSLAGPDEVLRGKINLNTASQRELESLPGIGPAYAERIIDYRNENGPFRKKEDLMKVKGIGEKRYENLRDHITVE